MACSWQPLLIQWGVHDLWWSSQTEGDGLCPLGEKIPLYVAFITTERQLFTIRDQSDPGIHAQLEPSSTSTEATYTTQLSHNYQ